MSKSITALLVLGAIALTAMLVSSQKGTFGSGITDSSITNVTNTSSTVGNVATLLVAANQSRNYLLVCNNSAQAAYLHLKDTQNTTGVALDTGIYLSPIGLTTSTANICVDLSRFNGNVYGISPATGTASIVKN